MLGSRTILIVDANSYSALDLSQMIEDSDGCVAGPVSTHPETLEILGSAHVGGAVVDYELAEAREIVALLLERAIPTIVQISATLPDSMTALDGKASVLRRPVDARTILECLLIEIGRSD